MAKEHYKDLQNKYVFYIVAIVLVVEVVAFAALIMNYGPYFSMALSENVGGLATGNQAQIAIQARQPGCIDSDMGTYYRTAGVVSYKGGKFYDNCVGSTLNEKYCEYDDYGNLVLETHNYRCKWGCEDGACY